MISPILQQKAVEQLAVDMTQRLAIGIKAARFKQHPVPVGSGFACATMHSEDDMPCDFA